MELTACAPAILGTRPGSRGGCKSGWCGSFQACTDCSREKAKVRRNPSPISHQAACFQLEDVNTTSGIYHQGQLCNANLLTCFALADAKARSLTPPPRHSGAVVSTAVHIWTAREAQFRISYSLGFCRDNLAFLFLLWLSFHPRLWSYIPVPREEEENSELLPWGRRGPVSKLDPCCSVLSWQSL